MSDNLPRVLVVAPQPFNYITGFGITVSNLFKGWSADCLACIYSEDIAPDKSVCHTYYKLSNKDRGWLFPFNTAFFVYNQYLKYTQTPLNNIKHNLDALIIEHVNERRSLKTRIIKRTMALGIGNAAYISIKDNIKEWLLQYKPEIIYCSPVSLSDVVSALGLAKFCDAMIAVHIMDDWPAHIKTDDNILSSFWHSISDWQLKRLFSKSKLRITIGENMSHAYHKRYGGDFLSFQNCPEADIWIKHGNKRLSNPDAFKIVFTGAVYESCNKQSLLDIAIALDYLNMNSDVKCCMDIYVIENTINRLKKTFKNLPLVNIYELIPDQEVVAQLYGDADALIIPFDFSVDAINLCKYSMPTKLPAYMLSGTPIIIYGPKILSVAQFIAKNKAGFIITKRYNTNDLAMKFNEIITNQTYKKLYSNTARAIAINRMSADAVRPVFQKALLGIAG